VVTASRENHKADDNDGGDQAASPPATFPFEMFDTSLKNLGSRTPSAGWFLGHDVVSWIVPRLS